MMSFSLQRWINNYKQEAISAVLPGVAFGQLWRILGNVETAPLTISVMVVFTALLGMVVSVLGSLNERRREMAILCSIGAKPHHIFGLLMTEAICLVLAEIAIGMVAIYLFLFFDRQDVEDMTELYLELNVIGNNEILFACCDYVRRSDCVCLSCGQSL